MTAKFSKNLQVAKREGSFAYELPYEIVYAPSNPTNPNVHTHTITTPVARTAGGSDRDKANAHLFAASPEMYEALEYCLVYLAGKHRGVEQGTIDRALHLARTALGKARQGQGEE